MKAKKFSKLGVFEPITIEVTIQTEDELLDLYHRLDYDAINFKGLHRELVDDDSSFELWNILDNYITNKLN